MQDILADTQLGIERDCGWIGDISLDIYNVGATIGCNRFQMINQGRCDALAAAFVGNSKIINIDLAALLLEFSEFVSHEPANNYVATYGCKSDKVISSEKACQVRVRRLVLQISFGVFESGTENCQELTDTTTVAPR